MHPYRLKAGDRTSDRLRSEIFRAEAVLGILTPNTSSSSYVLFELGASWGREGTTLPLLANGSTSVDVPSPISNLHSLSLDDEDDCYQLLDDIASATTLTRRSADKKDLAEHINRLVAIAKQ